MAQVIVKPEDLRKFARKLNSFNAKLQGDFASLHTQYRAMSQTWRDQEHAKFAAEFDQAAKAIKKFLAASNRFVPFIDGKARAAEDYLRRGR